MHFSTGLTLLCAGLAAAAPAHHRSQGSGRTSRTRDSSSRTATATATAAVSAVSSVVATTAEATSVAATSAAAPSSVASSTPSTGSDGASSSNGTLWQPASGASWQIVLSEKIDASTTLTPDVDIYDIDMFGNDATTISQLHAKGKKVICYFSAGSYEPYRDDSSQFTSADMGSALDGWPDEKWLNIDSTNVRNIMTKRIELAASKGCDAVDPDNVDGFGNDNGLGLTADQTHNYMLFLSDTAAANGMSIGLKNAVSLIANLVDTVHFAVNEQCHAYDECDHFLPFAQANKPVFNIEYPESAPSVSSASLSAACTSISGASSDALSTIIKTMDLDGWVQFCDSATADTATST